MNYNGYEDGNLNRNQNGNGVSSSYSSGRSKTSRLTSDSNYLCSGGAPQKEHNANGTECGKKWQMAEKES